MQSTTPSAREDHAWRHFPLFEKILGTPTQDPVIDRIADTCRRLDHAARKGTEADRARARKAIVAFGRTLDLLQQLAAMRDSNLSSASLDNRAGGQG
jgi:hypothetical protein